MVADVMTGHTDLADWILLLGVILAVLAVVVSIPAKAHAAAAWYSALVAGAVACIAFALLAL
jgi:hypothetical protein